MSRLNTTRIGLVWTGVLAALPLAVLHAQDAPAPTTQAATVPYVDEAFGFELRLPAGWNYDRAGFFGPGGSLGLLRGVAPDGRATLQILAFRELLMPSFPEWVEFFSKQLGSISGIEEVRVKGETDAKRPAAYLIAEAQLGFERTRTLYYCVQFDADTIWVFSYALALSKTLDKGAQDRTPDTPADVQIPEEFTRLTGTLRVFYNPQLAQELAVALQRGRAYLTRYQLQADIGELRIDEAVRYYEIRVGNKPIGYLTCQFTRENEPLQRAGRTPNAKEGLRVRERSYRFADDGTVHISKTDLFSSRDTETDLYELWRVRLPPPDAPDSEPLIMRDQCVRERDALFSTYTTSRDQGLPPPRRPIKLEPTYLGLAWARVLPALLGPQPQPMCAFAVYDPETRTVITHAVRPLGERPLPGESAQKAYAFETRKGFGEQPALVFTDALGNMLRLEAGELVLRTSNKATIEWEFGRRRDAANARLQGRP
jgi:hypothetical protein